MSTGMDRVLVACWLMVLAVGVVMVASASVATGGVGMLMRQLIYLGVALGGVLVVLMSPLSLLREHYRWAFAGSIGLLLVVLLPGLSASANGAARWIPLGPVTVQPAEWVKLLFPIFIAGYLARFHKGVQDGFGRLWQPLAALGALGVLLLIQPDFGSTVVLAAVTIGQLFLAGARLRNFLALLLVGPVVFGLLAVLEPYRVERLVTFLDPWKVAFDEGYQLTQALIAFGRGEIFGMGLGESIQKLAYLPEAHNDFIFAVLVEELGVIGGLLLLALFTCLTLRIFRIARLAITEGDHFGGFMVYGIGLMLGVQSLVNVGVNTGVLPTKGLTLPFVSYGANSLIVSCLMIGLVLRLQMERSYRE